MSNSNAEAPSPAKRDASWYIKWVFASYAAAFGLFLLVALACLPFFGSSPLTLLVSPVGGFVVLVTAAVLSPLVYRYLK